MPLTLQEEAGQKSELHCEDKFPLLVLFSYQINRFAKNDQLSRTGSVLTRAEPGEWGYTVSRTGFQQPGTEAQLHTVTLSSLRSSLIF